jgi:hypothetical protein
MTVDASAGNYRSLVMHLRVRAVPAGEHTRAAGQVNDIDITDRYGICWRTLRKSPEKLAPCTVIYTMMINNGALFIMNAQFRR